MTCGDIRIGATAVAPTLHIPDTASEEQSLSTELGCSCVQRPSQRHVIRPPDDEAAIDR